MISSSQSGFQDATVLPAAPRVVGTAVRARPLPRGVGLAIGGMVSLGLWAGLIRGAIQLF